MSGDEYPGKSAYRGMVASRYDEDRIAESIWAVEQAFVQTWVGSLPPGREILDVPAGTGRFLECFHARGLRIRALDVSADMVAEIHRRYPEISKIANVGIGDAERLPLADDAVDYVISWRFFHLIPGPVVDRVLREFHRVCRGPVVVQVFAVRPSFWRRAWAGVGRRLGRTAAPKPVPGASPAPASPWAHIQDFSHTESGLRARFQAAGFSVERAVTLDAQGGRPNRVYFLRRASAEAGRP